MAEILKARFPVTGMSCAACAASIGSVLESIPGVESVSVNFAGNEVSLDYDPGLTGPQAFRQSLQSAGYDLIIAPGRERELAEEYRRNRYRRLRRDLLGAAVFSIPVFVISMFFHSPFPGKSLLLLLLTTPVLFLFGRQFFINGFRQARHFRANMDTLVALSTGVAYGYSLYRVIFSLIPGTSHPSGIYFESAAVIITFILLGRVLEERAKGRTSAALKRLISLRPDRVIRISGEKEEVVPVMQIVAGDHLLIRPGDRIPVDGVILSGTSTVDESMITGESFPVDKVAGDPVYSGTLNLNGMLRLLAAKVGSETLLGKIIGRVEEAQAGKAPIQQVADRIAGIFVPAVLVISLLTFGSWLLAGGADGLTHAFLTMVSVLIIACPCALGLATPTAIMVGMGKGAEQGILFRDAESLEMLHKVDVVVMDKTGTLTLGTPRPAWPDGGDGFDRLDRVRRGIFALMEARSGHPLGEAIASAAAGSGNTEIVFGQFRVVPGKGITATVNGTEYHAGNLALMKEKTVDLSGLGEQINAYDRQGYTLVFFAEGRKLLLVVPLTDTLRPGAVEAVSGLKDMGIQVHMLTGDREAVAARIAARTGISEYRSGVLPLQKEEYIRQLQKAGFVVAMVGDGINDAAGLAGADVGIAMGKGTAIALEAARVTLVRQDLRQVARAIALSVSTVRTIRQNLFWAFFYNIAAIPVAAGVLYPFWGFLLDPMIAGAAMALSSVSVVTNSLRLKTKKIYP